MGNPIEVRPFAAKGRKSVKFPVSCSEPQPPLCLEMTPLIIISEKFLDEPVRTHA